MPVVIAITLQYFYCTLVLLLQGGQLLDTDDFEPKRTRPIVWQSESIENNTNTNTGHCRNSVQGKSLIVDDRGYVCHRPDIQWSGCCNSDAVGTKRYSCETCNTNRCCMIYEHCASCCLNPNKVSTIHIYAMFG